MIKFEPDHFREEIEYNLKTLEDTVGKNVIPDLGFIEIFVKDIETLRKCEYDPSKIAPLTRRLEVVADKMTNVSATVFDDVDVPRMGPKQDLGDVAAAYTEKSDTRSGLQALSANYDICRIKGDGHCLFRSAGAEFLRAVLESGNPGDKLERLRRFVESQPELKKEFQSIESRLSQLKGKKFVEVMNDQKVSDGIVKFLRNASAEWLNENRDREDLALEEMAEELGMTFNQYLKDIKKEMIGGELELLALANILGVKIRIHDAFAIGNSQKQNDEASALGPEDADATLNLLYRPGHYDILIPKSG